MSYRSIVDARELPAEVPRSDVESARFGVEFGRLEIGPDADVTLPQLKALVASSPLDVIMIRYPAARIEIAAGLQIADRRTHHADTLMYYRCDLSRQRRQSSLVDGFTAHTAEPSDSSVIARLVHETFDEYGNHYRTNPLLAAHRIAEGYVEWALHTAFEIPNTRAVLVRDVDGVAQGFAVTSGGPSPELLLTGVRSEVRRRGVYTSMLAAELSRVAGSRRDAFYASTQAQNLGSQRAWISLGFRLELVLNTVHVTKSDLLADAGAVERPLET